MALDGLLLLSGGFVVKKKTHHHYSLHLWPIAPSLAMNMNFHPKKPSSWMKKLMAEPEKESEETRLNITAAAWKKLFLEHNVHQISTTTTTTRKTEWFENSSLFLFIPWKKRKGKNEVIPEMLPYQPLLNKSPMCTLSPVTRCWPTIDKTKIVRSVTSCVCYRSRYGDNRHPAIAMTLSLMKTCSNRHVFPSTFFFSLSLGYCSCQTTSWECRLDFQVASFLFWLDDIQQLRTSAHDGEWLFRQSALVFNVVGQTQTLDRHHSADTGPPPPIEKRHATRR